MLPSISAGCSYSAGRLPLSLFENRFRNHLKRCRITSKEPLHPQDSHSALSHPLPHQRSPSKLYLYHGQPALNLSTSLLLKDNNLLLRSTWQHLDSCCLRRCSVQMRPSHMTVDRCAFTIRQPDLVGCRLWTAPGLPGSHQCSGFIDVALGYCRDDIVWNEWMPRRYYSLKYWSPWYWTSLCALENRHHVEYARAATGPRWKW